MSGGRSVLGYTGAMRTIEYQRAGGPEVLSLVERDVPEPGPGQVRVRMAVSGVNPTDWKSRRSTDPVGGAQTPNQDGSGTVDAVGSGVDAARVGERVWLWEGAHDNRFGTAAQYSVLPDRRAVAMPDWVPFDLGAALGVPFLTAHRCLTLGELVPDRLGPGTLDGVHVLVHGGAGAVGNAAIQLARWSDATVIATVSSPAKAQLAAAAGADHVLNYREQDVVEHVHRIVPGGVAAVVEVSAAANAAIDAQVLATHGAVAMYADDGGEQVTLPVRAQMMRNARWQFVLVYTLAMAAKYDAIDAISAAVDSGALRIGEHAGLPLHRFALADTGAAQQAVQDGVVGKVLIDIDR